MNQPLLPTDHLYANLMDEVRSRLLVMNTAISDRDAWIPRYLQEFCYLQLRMLTEQIAVGCLIAHGDITNQDVLNNWRIPVVMKKLAKLKPDFYPKWVLIEVGENGVNCEYHDHPQLSKEDLVRLWIMSGDYLHRGTAKSVFREDPCGPTVNIGEIIEWAQKISNLLSQHIISSTDNKTHLLVALVHGATGRSAVWVVKA